MIILKHARFGGKYTGHLILHLRPIHALGYACHHEISPTGILNNVCYISVYQVATLIHPLAIAISGLQQDKLNLDFTTAHK